MSTTVTVYPLDVAARMAAAHLTPAERNTLVLLSKGRTNIEIAEARGVGHNTVLNHVHIVYQKIGVGHLPGGVSRVRAALWFHGLWVPA